MKNRKFQLVKEYKDILLKASGIDTLPIDNNISEKAAELRALFHLNTPDAIKIATTILHGGKFFLTNDFRLKNTTITKVLILEELI